MVVQNRDLETGVQDAPWVVKMPLTKRPFATSLTTQNLAFLS